MSPDTIVPLKVTPEARRKLVLIGKILQNLANGIEFTDKEQYMKLTNDFIRKNQPKITQFLHDLCVIYSLQI